MKEQTLSRIESVTKFTQEEISIIQATVAKNTTALELAYFLNVAKSVNLNPFNKEIWCYKDNKGNVIVITGRDGFLRIAQRSKLWNGIASSDVRANDEFHLDIPNGKVHHIIKPKDRGAIIGAYAILRPKDCEITTIEYADFDTYNKGYNVWKSNPASMIKKVAESHALKKAYGISGIYDEYSFDEQNGIAMPISKQKTKKEYLDEIDKAKSINELICYDIYSQDFELMNAYKNKFNQLNTKS